MHNEQVVVSGVNVIPMTQETVLHDHVVVVHGGRITAVGPGDVVDIPTAARVIDGQGGYLIPGLADMHVHLAFRDPDPAHLILYLAEGVTTVRSLSGFPANAEWRAAVERGEMIGPTIMTADRIIVGGLEGLDPDLVAAAPVFVPETAARAAEEVRRQANGYCDLVKVYDGLQAEAYLAAISAANDAGIYVIGHVLDELDLETVLTSGIDEIAHVDELNYSHWVGRPDDADFRMDYEAIPATVGMMVENEVAIVSNLVGDEIMCGLIFDPEEVFGRADYRVVRPDLMETWQEKGRHKGSFASQGTYRRDIEMPFFQALLGSLHDAGAIVTIGTDTSPGLEGSLPTNIHRELELLVESGFSPYEALVAGTRDAARVVERMGGDPGFGTIEPGQRGDLVLLGDNPLGDVGHTRDRLGVMARGRWRSRDDLDRMVDDLVASY